MRPLRLIFVVLSALFVIAGWSSLARAEEMSSHDSEHARPGTYAARFGAPLCDARAASSFAAEPRARAVDESVAVTARPERCRDHARTADRSNAPNRDDLQRSAPGARQVAFLPKAISIPRRPILAPHWARVALDGARDAFLRVDLPPPRG